MRQQLQAYVAGSVFAAAFVAVAVLILSGNAGPDRSIAVYPLIGAGVVVLVMVIGGVVSARGDRRLRELAAVAGLRGFGFARRLDGLGLPGTLFRAGEKTVATGVVDARHSGTPFLAGGLTAQYGTDTSMARAVAASFVAIPLEKTVPHIVLFGAGIGMLRRAGYAVDERRRLSLEGDFDRHFTLYCPEGYERDALQIFTPDLMQLLIDTTHGCDVELVDDWLFVYSAQGRYSTADALDGLVAVTERVRDKVARQTGRYRDERSTIAGPTVSPEEHAARAGRVAAGGSRLASRQTLVQRLAGAASALVLVGAIISYFLTQQP